MRLSARKGHVTLSAVFAHYLPADAALEARLAGCERQPDDTLTSAVYGASYPYRVLRYCVPQFDDVYKAAKGDLAALEKTARWHFSDGTGGVSLSLLRGATLEVAKENVTPALLSSDAACPGQVGFQATIDALSGAVVGTAPGIGCIVCLAP